MSPDIRAARQQRLRESRALLPALSRWQVELDWPCLVCGCMLWVPVSGGVLPGRGRRCLQCMPPLDVPAELKERIKKLSERPWRPPDFLREEENPL